LLSSHRLIVLQPSSVDDVLLLLLLKTNPRR
jgi:hypothetical protein